MSNVVKSNEVVYAFSDADGDNGVLLYEQLTNWWEVRTTEEERGSCEGETLYFMTNWYYDLYMQSLPENLRLDSLHDETRGNMHMVIDSIDQCSGGVAGPYDYYVDYYVGDCEEKDMGAKAFAEIIKLLVSLGSK